MPAGNVTAGSFSSSVRIPVSRGSTTAPSSGVPTRLSCSAASSRAGRFARRSSTARIAASARLARLCASALLLVEGASMTTYPVCRRSASSVSRSRCDCIKPAAVAAPPVVMTRSDGMRGVRCIALFRPIRPASRSERPGIAEMPSIRASGAASITLSGRCAPISTTSLPVRASAAARFAATSVVAEPRLAPVTTMIWSPLLRLARISLRSRLKTRPPGPYGCSTSSKLGVVRSSSAASTGMRPRSRTSAAVRRRRSKRSRANASASPASRPSIPPVAMLSIALGLVGDSGSRASLMMLPAPTVAVVSSLSRPVRLFSWFCELLRRLSRLLRSELPSAARASRLLMPVRVVVSCLTFRVSVLIC
jgi:hypothetical protein